MMGMYKSASGIREVLASTGSAGLAATAMREPLAVSGPITEVEVPGDGGSKTAQMRSAWRRADILIAREAGEEVDDRGRPRNSPSPSDGYEPDAGPPKLMQATNGSAASSASGITRKTAKGSATEAASPARASSTRRSGQASSQRTVAEAKSSRGATSSSKAMPSTGSGSGGGGGSGSRAGPASGSGAAMPEAVFSGTVGGNSRVLDPSMLTKRQIRAIISKDDQGGVSGAALISGLEKNIKGVLMTKRREYDALKQEVKGLQRQREALTLRLRDLQEDGRALGFAAEADRSKRLKPVESITRKPVFAEGTQLRDMVERHQAEADEREAVIAAGFRYVHMRDRLGREIVALRRRVTDLEEAKVEEIALERELAKRIIIAQEALGNTRTRLSRLRRGVRKEKTLWMGEIADQHAFLDSKAGFETFLEKQMERHRQLEQEAERRRAARQEDKVKRRNAVNLLAHTGYASRLQQNLLGAKSEEAEYEEAFRRLGAVVLVAVTSPRRRGSSGIQSAVAAGGKAKGSDSPDRAATRSGVTRKSAEGEVDPAAVLKLVGEQQAVWSELVEKLESEEDRVAQLAAKLEEAKRAEEAPEAVTAAPRAHRQLAEQEARLQELHKSVEAERARLDFTHTSIEPVRLGLQVISERLLDTYASFDAPSSTRRVMRALKGKIAVIMDECRRMRAKEADADGDAAASRSASPAGDHVSASLVAPASPVSSVGGTRGRSGAAASSATSAAMEEALSAAAELGVSSFNIRVQPRSAEAHVLAVHRAEHAQRRAAAKDAPSNDITAAVLLPEARSRRRAPSAATIKAKALADRLELWAADTAADGRPPVIGRIPKLREPVPSVRDVQLDESEALAEVGGDYSQVAEARVSLAQAQSRAETRARRNSAIRAAAGAIPFMQGTATLQLLAPAVSAPALPAVALHPMSRTYKHSARPQLVPRSDMQSRTQPRLPAMAGAFGGGKDDEGDYGRAGSTLSMAKTRAGVDAQVEGGWEAEGEEDEVWDRSEVKKIARNVLAAGRRRDKELRDAEDA